jgi:DNA-binding winged helix-turn-helix (wHTH) protein/tetratricopeptide (TPR) repeat protein
MSSEAVRVEQPVKYQFGEFELFPNQGALWRSGVRVPLMPKPLATLLVLVEHAGETVSKDELLAQVWGGTAVEENNLTQSISTLRKVLGEKRGDNRFIATEPGTGYRFVAEVIRIAEAPPKPPEAVTLVPPTGTLPLSSNPSLSPRLLFLFSAIGLICLVAITFLWKPHPASKGAGRKSVAVLGIRNLSKGSAEAWLQTAFLEMLTSELAAGGNLRTTPAEDVVRWRSDLGAGADGAGRAELLRMASRNFGADTLILGSYVVTGTCPECRVRVDLGLFDTASGDSFGAIIDEGPEQDLLDLTRRVGVRLRAELGVGGKLAPPPSWTASSAMREYAEGLNALRRVDPLAARDHLEAALAADPGNALVHAALADTWAALGYGSRANEESRRAYELSLTLGRLDQLSIEARYRASAQQWDRAIDIYQSIFRLFPDSLEDGLNLAKAQFRGMKNADASATLRVLRRLPAPAGNDPRIDLIEAQTAGTARDFLKTRDYARRAANEARSRGARYLFARARLLEGGAMQNLRDPNYYEVQTEARKVCEDLGDRQCVSQAWRIRGNERFVTGHFAEAQEAYRKGVTVARDLGDRAELANLLTGFGVVAESKREWLEAEKNFLEAISLKKETGYNPSEIQIQLAELYLRLGRLSDAAQVSEAAYSEAQKTNAHEDLGEVFQLRAALARSQGRLDTAQELEEKAITELRVSSSSALPLALAADSSILTARGDLQNAERRLADASVSNYPEGQGDIELSRAELLLAKGQFQQAADEAKRSAADFTNAHLDENAAAALVTEAHALDMLGRNSDALRACQEAERRAVQAPSAFAITLARLTTWQLRGDADLNVPADLHANVVRMRNPELSLEEDFDRAVRAKRAGAPGASKLFRAFADQAANKGYVTLSRRARSLEQ